MIQRWIFCAMVLLAAAYPRAGDAQAVLPRAGQSFSFGIIEGAYSFADSESDLDTTILTLTVVSAYSGCGTISSPSGYSQNFNFSPGTPTILTLPMDLMHLNDLGRTEKGLLVHTTEPVNLVLHDYVQFGGDATQILPDNALDTSYITCGWGIWDDFEENNLNEFLVTATEDSTLVTITPSVNTLLGQQRSMPFVTMLNRGECYIVKADTNGRPSDPSLSGSIIHATKPVSVISGVTCAYVPVGDEACNELMDELLGQKWWGTHFFMQPLDVNDFGGQLVLTSSGDFRANINGTTYRSVNSRLATQFLGTVEIHTTDSKGNPFPVEAHQLTRTFTDCDTGIGDPSLVTILDTSYYSDTALWNTPSFEFSHSVPIICPTADLGKATLDGMPLDQLGTQSTVINGSSYSAINPQIQAGLHEIVSPDPIFAIAAGFYDADAYTFIAGTAGSPASGPQHSVILQADSAMICSDFTVTALLATPILTSEGVSSLTITMTYDPSTIELKGFVPMSILTTGSYTVDTSISGTIVISVNSSSPIAGSNLFQLIFQGLKTTPATNLEISGSASVMCEGVENLLASPFTLAVGSGNPSAPITITQIQTAVTKSGYETSVAFDINPSSYPILSLQTLIHANISFKNITIDSLPGWILDTSSIDSESLILNYTRDTNSTTTNGHGVLTFSYSDSESNNIQFSITPTFVNGQTISHCVSGSSYTFKPNCADPILREALNGTISFSIERIVPNPAQNQITVVVTGVSSMNVLFMISDPLGRRYIVPQSGNTLDVSSLPSGVYYVSDGVTAAKFVKE